jgi:dolichol-phosphate mannosyltransferase
METIDLSIVTPAYNEARNLPALYEQIRTALAGLSLTWEWVIVDDHSRDETFSVIQALAVRDSRVRGVRMARNSGSHRVICCGLALARGACAAVMAADLQDPPETLPQLLAKWREGAQVVWAVRAGREGEKASTLAFARAYYWIMRRVIGMKDMPSEGADFLLLDRCVINALRQFGESNISLFSLISWMGFRQTSIQYVKQSRLHGNSGWTIGKKVKLVVDSVTAFSYLPIRAMSVLGLCCGLFGFLYAGWVAFNFVSGRPQAGWSSLMIVTLLIGGVLMLMMGVLGEYLWRSLDESRRRPHFLIEDSTEPDTLSATVTSSFSRRDQFVIDQILVEDKVLS